MSRTRQRKIDPEVARLAAIAGDESQPRDARMAAINSLSAIAEETKDDPKRASVFLDVVEEFRKLGWPDARNKRPLKRDIQ